MKELEQNLQQRNQNRKSLKQQIREQLKTQMNKIDNLLSIANRMRGVRKIIKQCTKFMKQHEETQKQANLIYKYDSRLDYEFEQYNESPKHIQNSQQFPVIEFELRNNWIQRYLNRKDVKVLGKVKGMQVTIISERNNVVNYQTNSSSQNQQNLLTETQIQTVSLKQLQSKNKKLTAKFMANRYQYSIKNNLIKIQIDQYQQNQQQDRKTTTFVININHALNCEANGIRRLLIFKKSIPKQQQKQQQQLLLSPRSFPSSIQQHNYEIYDGFYQCQDSSVSIQLPQGNYIFYPFSNTDVTIYSQNILNLSYVPQFRRNQLKQYNLMLQTFPQCHPQNITAQFIRQIDLSAGIVIDIYKNEHENQIYFTQVADLTHTDEDKRLMFRSLYSDRHRSYRLKRGQIIVEFYQVTAKPAVLYQPNKRVFIDKQQLYEAKTVHSILK